MKLGAYTRLSKDEEGIADSPEVQYAAIVDWAPRNDHEIKGPYVDRDISGGLDFDARPGWMQLWEDLKAGKIDGVVCLCLDRLARDLRNQLNLAWEVHRLKKCILFVKEQFDDTAQGRLMFQMLGAFSEHYRRNIGDKCKDKQRWLHKQGKWPCGIPPMGYKLQDKLLVVDDERKEDALTVFRVFIEHNGNRTATARALMGQGIRGNRGALLGENNIRRIVSNPLYRGVLRYRGVDVPLSGLELIIPPDVAETAARLFESSRQHVTRGKHVWAYGGWLTCAYCGARYSGTVTNIRYYQCRNRSCEGSGISERRVDALVGKAMVELLRLHKERILAAPDVMPPTKPVSHKDADAAKARLLDLYEVGALSKEKYLERIKKYQIKPEVASVQQQVLPVAVGSITIEEWQLFTPDAKRQLLGLLVDSMLLDTNKPAQLVLVSSYAPGPVITRE